MGSITTPDTLLADLEPLRLETPKGPLKDLRFAWLKPFPLDTPDEILRKELFENGMVMIKHAMPREYVQDTRRRFFEHVAHSGVLKPDTEPVDGIWCGGDPHEFSWPRTSPRDPSSEGKDYDELAAEIHTADWINEFSGNKYLIAIMNRLKPNWNKPFVLRRQIFRTVMPESDNCTGVHYDQVFLRQGPADSAITGWIPIGDCSAKSGGLMYMEDSLGFGQAMEKKFDEMSEAKGLDPEVRKLAYNVNMTPEEGQGFGQDLHDFAHQQASGRRWLIADYEAGDVVFHTMHTLHASAKNHDPEGRIRFSADVRFADRDGNYDRRWDNPFVPGDGL